MHPTEKVVRQFHESWDIRDYDLSFPLKLDHYFDREREAGDGSKTNRRLRVNCIDHLSPLTCLHKGNIRSI